jgi:hypothetical protein
MSFKHSRKVAVLLAAVSACAFVALGAGAATALPDPPLTVRIIIEDWDINPSQDPEAYIRLTVQPRGVNFLPTAGVRNELRVGGVPEAVINSLRLNPSDESKFKFQVWEFSAAPGTLTPDKSSDLARQILNQLQSQASHSQASHLSDVFTHFKPPVPEICVETGNRCPNSSRPRVHVRGKVVKESGRLTAKFWLSYKSPDNEGQPLGPDRVAIISATTEEGLNAAAKDIVQKIQQNIRGELLWE